MPKNKMNKEITRYLSRYCVLCINHEINVKGYCSRATLKAAWYQAYENAKELFPVKSEVTLMCCVLDSGKVVKDYCKRKEIKFKD